MSGAFCRLRNLFQLLGNWFSFMFTLRQTLNLQFIDFQHRYIDILSCVTRFFCFTCNSLYSRVRAKLLIAGFYMKRSWKLCKTVSSSVIDISLVTLILKLALWDEMTSLQFCDSNAKRWQTRRRHSFKSTVQLLA